jgi:hypothetical protein
VQIVTKDGVLVRHRAPFNNNRVFGKSHYGIVHVAVPAYTGEVTVRLLMTYPESQSLPQGTAVEPSWHFPNFS